MILGALELCLSHQQEMHLSSLMSGLTHYGEKGGTLPSNPFNSLLMQHQEIGPLTTLMWKIWESGLSLSSPLVAPKISPRPLTFDVIRKRGYKRITSPGWSLELDVRQSVMCLFSERFSIIYALKEVKEVFFQLY